MPEIQPDNKQSKFEQLYLRYRGLMFRVANSLLHNEQDAEDAVHQAFLAILPHLDKLDEVDCPKTWSYIVITTENKAIDLLRARKRILPFAFDETQVGVEFPLPGDHGLADAIARLPARYRQALLLRYDSGYDTQELAKMLHMSRSSVQKLLWRAKSALKAQLEKEATEHAE